MLVEQLYMNEYMCAQQGSYHHHEHLLELQFMMEMLKQFPIENFQRFHEGLDDKIRRWQPAERFISHMTSISTEPMSYLNPNLLSEGAACRSRQLSNRPVFFSKKKQDVSGFSSKRAEHAQRVYQSKGPQPLQKFRHNMVPPYRPNYDSMLVSRHRKTEVTKGSYLLGKHVHDRSVNQTTLYTDLLKGQVPVPVTSQPFEMVLRVAKISPRPNKKQPTKKTSVKLPYVKVERGLGKKSDVVQNSRYKIELSNMPIFQILCEMNTA